MLTTLRDLTSDGWLLFATRSIRLFAYGGLSVVLVFYLVSLGLTESDVGLLLTVTLLGDTLISLILTTQADRIGRRRMLIVGAALMAAAGLVFGFTARFWLLVIAGTALAIRAYDPQAFSLRSTDSFEHRTAGSGDSARGADGDARHDEDN